MNMIYFRKYQISMKIFYNFLFFCGKICILRYIEIEFSTEQTKYCFNKKVLTRKLRSVKPVKDIDEAGLLND